MQLEAVPDGDGGAVLPKMIMMMKVNHGYYLFDGPTGLVTEETIGRFVNDFQTGKLEPIALAKIEDFFEEERFSEEEESFSGDEF